MAKQVEVGADASPEKRLFIALLTRDISLVDAILDLIDNSINSAIIVAHEKLSEPEDYISLLQRNAKASLPTITIAFDERHFSIIDTCGGISFKHAEKHVFRFGREAPEENGTPTDDRLSVYGIGLKRAIFKIGDHIEVTSGSGSRLSYESACEGVGTHAARKMDHSDN